VEVAGGGGAAQVGGGRAGVEPCPVTSREPGVQHVGGKERGKEKGRREKNKREKAKSKKQKKKKKKKRERGKERELSAGFAAAVGHTLTAAFARSATSTRNKRK